MGDFGVRSTNMFDALQQPKADKASSVTKAPAKSEVKKAAKAAAAAAAPPAKPAADKPRTGSKRGGLANKGTRPTAAKGATTDSRGKRLMDRQSEQNFQKGHGAARKGGMNFGGNADLAAEAGAATEDFNAGAKDVAAAPADGKAAATDAAAGEEKKEVVVEVPDLRKTLAEYNAELAAKVPKDDVKAARKAVVGKEFKAGSVAVSKKGKEESLFSEVKADKEAEKKAEATASKPKKAAKETKAPVKKAEKKVLPLDAFNDTVKPAAPARAPAPVAAAAPAAAARGAGAAGPRGGRGGARGGRGGAGRGGRAPIDFTASFPPLK